MLNIGLNLKEILKGKEKEKVLIFSNKEFQDLKESLELLRMANDTLVINKEGRLGLDESKILKIMTTNVKKVTSIINI